MLMKSQSYTIEETDRLMNEYNMNDTNSNEIINIYFECFRDICSYSDFLKENIRIIPKDHELVELLLELDDACLFDNDDSYILTNYQDMVDLYEIKI